MTNNFADLFHVFGTTFPEGIFSAQRSTKSPIDAQNSRQQANIPRHGGRTDMCTVEAQQGRKDGCNRVDLCKTDEVSAVDIRRLNQGAFSITVRTIPPLGFVEPKSNTVVSSLD